MTTTAVETQVPPWVQPFGFELRQYVLDDSTDIMLGDWIVDIGTLRQVGAVDMIDRAVGERAVHIAHFVHQGGVENKAHGFSDDASLTVWRSAEAYVNDLTLYNINILVHTKGNAISVEQVTAERAYEVAENIGMAWNRALPEPMRERQTSAARLDEEGSFSVDDDSIAVNMRRSAGQATQSPRTHNTWDGNHSRKGYDMTRVRVPLSAQLPTAGPVQEATCGRAGRTLITPEQFTRLSARIATEHDMDHQAAERIMDQALVFLGTCAVSTASLSPSATVDIGWHTPFPTPRVTASSAAAWRAASSITSRPTRAAPSATYATVARTGL